MQIKFDNKEEVRQYIWQMLEDRNIADFPKPCFGRIPNFVGSRDAAEEIRKLQEFKQANCIFSAPDFVLKPIREITLKEGKILTVALPRMTDFVEIKERKFIDEATSIKGFTKFGKPLKTKIDLFVQGSVAVDLKGNRLGKGTGYGDQEWDYLVKRGLILSDTKVITLVHSMQILDDFSYLAEETDKKVDYIITEKEIIKI